MNKIIQVDQLKKSYGPVEAVKGISFYVEEGKLFAFLGPNGAGKSTTIDILCTLLKPDSGTVAIDGYTLGQDDHQIRRSIGVVFQDGLLDPLLTVKENLYTRGRLYNQTGSQLKQAVEQAAEAAGVTAFWNRPYGKLSGGQRRRADIARALVHTPKILFLDEPTTGLDPQTRQNIWETIRNLQAQQQVTVFMTTHYMEEAADADYVIVIDNGLIAARGTPAQLKQQYSSDILKLQTRAYDRLKPLLEERQLAHSCHGDVVTIPLDSTLAAIPILNACQPYIEGFEVLSGNMDSAFINITGKEMR